MSSLAPDSRPRYSISVAAELTRPAPADAARLRGAGARAAAPDAGRHAPLLRGGPRPASQDQRPHRRARHEPRRSDPGARAGGHGRPPGRPGGRPPEAARRGRPPHAGARWPGCTARYRRELVRYQPPKPPVGMDFTKLTVKAQEAFASAQGDAVSRGNPELTPDHLLLALLTQEASVAARILEKAGLHPAAIRDAVEARLAGLPRMEGANVQPAASRATRQALEEAFTEAEALKDEYVAVEHLLLALAAGAELDRRGDPEGGRRGARRAARDLARRRGHLRGARQVRPRPDRRRRARQARPGHRPRPGGAPRDPGAVEAHEEQPGADRRAGRRQDRDRRGPRPADHLRRRPRGPRGQARVGARRRLAGRRHEVPGRVRGAAEGRPRRDPRLRGPDHRLHRRAAHDRRRGQGRGRGRRRQPAEADARPRRAARDRRHDARRVPQATSRRTRRSSAGSSR